MCLDYFKGCNNFPGIKTCFNQKTYFAGMYKRTSIPVLIGFKIALFFMEICPCFLHCVILKALNTSRVVPHFFVLIYCYSD